MITARVNKLQCISRLAAECCRFIAHKMTENHSEKLQFTQKSNPTTGKFEWIAENHEDHDYITDIARSSYADMLHDHERNKLYYKAIKLAVQAIHGRGEKAKVLDIGTGTGLLSMMAATVGAEHITAIEVFMPMAEIAEKIIKQNNFTNIKVINKHSTEVSISEDGDMKERANILVTELFDTELIGEGALTAYKHAHQHLMEENCIAVPHRAITYATIVESDTMLSWHEMQPFVLNTGGNTVEITPDPQMQSGSVVPAVHDIQLSQFPQEKLKEITKPVQVFDFCWGDMNISDQPRQSMIKVKAQTSGKAQVVLSWWDLEMDTNGEILLSTAPVWHHPTPDHMQWRDHWIQSVYFLPQQFNCSKGETLTIQAFHDAYSMWFQASNQDKDDVVTKILRPVCDYPPRMLWSRARMGRINDREMNATFAEALISISSSIPTEGIALCVSDFSLLPLIVTQTAFVGRKSRTVALEKSKMAQRGLFNLAKHNNLEVDVVCGEPQAITQDLGEQKISLLAGEPFFSSSYLPWHDFYFWYSRTELDSHLHPDFRIMPCKGHLCAAAVQFEDLWKIRAPVNQVEGFDISLMDEMVERALEIKEYHEPEPHALWEYPCVLLTDPNRIMSFDFRQTVPEMPISSVGNLPFYPQDSGSEPVACHGVVLWMEYDLDETHTVSTGLQPVSKQGKFDDVDRMNPVWCMHYKQAVFLFKKPVAFDKDSCKLNYDLTFQPKSGDVKMMFDVL